MITITKICREIGVWKVMSQHIFPSLTVAMLTLISLFVVDQQMHAQTICTMECPDDIVFNIPQDGCEPVIHYDLDFDQDCETSGLSGFDYAFSPSEWDLIIGEGDGSIDPSQAPESIELTGSDAGTSSEISTRYCIEIPFDDEVSFHWDYESFDSSPEYDPFGYSINGNFTQLTDDEGDLIQSGNVSFHVSEGDEFCFEIVSINDADGEAVVEVSNFRFNPPVLTEGLESGSTFPIGTTKVSYSFDPGDGSGSQQCSFDVTVTIPTPPDEDISCKQHVQVSVGSNCTAVITPDEMLAGNIPCADQLHIVEVEDRGTDVVDQDDLDQTLKVTVTRLDEDGTPTGNHCWGYVTVEDKQKPTIVCSVDTISCLEAINFVLPEAFDNCGPVDSIRLVGQMEIDTCDDLLIRIIERTYVAVDASGNVSDPCTQTLNVQRVNIELIDFPDDFTMDNALSCDDGFPMDVYGNPSPAHTGYPKLDSIEIMSQLDLICGISSRYSDEIVTSSGCKTIIIRTWTIAEWRCNESTNIITRQQEIHVVDKEGPTLVCPPDITVTTSPNQNCLAGVHIPVPFAEDECNEVGRISMSYSSGYQHNWQQGGDLYFSAGTDTITFTAFDICENSTSCIMQVTVVDETPPVPICKENTVVSLTSDGTARVFAESFDNGSYDECGDVTFDVRRMNEGCDMLTPQFRPYVDFYCCDLNHNPIQMILRVTDESDNANECMVFVEVQDKLPATINCPADIVVSCEYPFDEDDLSVFGTVVVVNDLTDLQNPLTDPRDSIIIHDSGNTEYSYYWGQDGFAYDNCAVWVIDEHETVEDMCGLDVITRTFYALGPDSSKVAECEQVIRIKNFSKFEYSSIEWPEKVTLENVCGGGDTHPDATGYPEYTQGICDKVHYTYEDQVFYTSTPSDPVCYKIIRTWTVIDWCQFYNGHYQTWSRDQVIMIINNEAPEFTGNCDDITVESFDPDCQSAHVELVQSATDDCTPESELIWKYDIDLDNNGLFDYSSTYNPQADNPNDPTDASGNYPVGTHRIVWTVSDGCNNTTTCQQLFTVVNMTVPKVICKGLSIEMMAMDTNGDGENDLAMLELNANAIDAGSYHTCGYDITFAYSPDPADSLRLFDCDDFGIQTVALYAIAENGAYDLCMVEINVQDNMQGCNASGGTSGGGSSGLISGMVTMEDGRGVNEVKVSLDGSQLDPSMTSANGNYHFPTMPLGGAYEVVPERDVDPREGVTTFDIALIQRHILGINHFTSPYQWIAADIDRNGTVDVRDIAQLRRVVLGTYDEFPNNTSWRFVDADFNFTGFNPLGEDFNETYMIPDFDQSMIGLDFIAVKIGDINGSADPSGVDGADERSLSDPLSFELENESFDANQRVEVEFKARDFAGVDAFQFTLLFDSETLELMDVESGSLKMDVSNIGQQGLSDGVVTFSWNDLTPVTLSDNEVLFTLVFEAHKGASVADVMNLSSMVTQSRAYVNGTAKNLDLHWMGDDMSASSFELYQNRPNPFRDETVIGFRMAQDAPATITIFDVTGKMVKNIESDFHKGYNEIRIDDLSGWTNQVYYYRLDTEGYSATKKMILVR